VEGQPLAANVLRLLEALEYLGAPLPARTEQALAEAARQRDAQKLQMLLDLHVLLVVSLNPESRVKVERGPAEAVLQQAGYTPVLVKVLNESTVTKRLAISSPQAGPSYAGVAELSMKRQQQEELRGASPAGGNPHEFWEGDRFLQVEMFQSPPMTAQLSGLEAEYAIALIYSSEDGRREATIAFDVGQGSQDLGFRAQTPVLFRVKPAVNVKLAIRDHDGQPTVAKLVFRDQQGHVHPPQGRRLAPDLFFQPHIYRADGDLVLLPPGRLTVWYSRGPEYRVLSREVTIPSDGEPTLRVDLRKA
jgi:hypothetical protein